MRNKIPLQNVVYNYRLTHDTGFAPNPYWGILTLATCKPQIRKYSKLDEAQEVWLAGWCNKDYKEAYRNKIGKSCNADQRDEYLIYLAKVAKKIPIGEYWIEYPEKRALATKNKRCLKRYGDNIYEKIDEYHYRQHNNISHRTAKDKKNRFERRKCFDLQ